MMMFQAHRFLSLFCLFVQCLGENPFVSRLQRGLWCFEQLNSTNNKFQQLGQAFFYSNGTFTINFLDEINSTWINQIDTIHSLNSPTTYAVIIQTSIRNHSFKWCSWYQFEADGNLLWRNCSSSSINIYKRSPSNCSFVDDENPSESLSKTDFERTLSRFDRLINESRGSPMVFYGSSSIRMWSNLSRDFARVSDNVMNRGFGGGTIKQCVQQFKRVILPLDPRWLFIYAGENDITDGEKPSVIRDNFQRLIQLVRRFYSTLPIFYISIKPSPSRWNKTSEMNETNRLIKDEIRNLRNVHFIDIFDQMLNQDGQIRSELFLGDNLHLNEQGYAIWTETILNYLKKPMESSISDRSSKDQISILILFVNISLFIFSFLTSRR